MASNPTESKNHDSPADAWIPAPRGEPVDLGGGPGTGDEATLPLSDQPQSKAGAAAANNERNDEVVVASEESFPASDPPSYQPSTTSRR